MLAEDMSTLEYDEAHSNYAVDNLHEDTRQTARANSQAHSNYDMYRQSLSGHRIPLVDTNVATLALKHAGLPRTRWP